MHDLWDYVLVLSVFPTVFIVSLKLIGTVIYHWRRQSYFFLAILDLKQGNSLVYAMVDFICEGLLELWGTRVERKYKMNNSCPQWDSNPVLSAYESNALTIVLWDLIASLWKRKVQVHCGQDFFIWNSRFTHSPYSWSKPMQMKSTLTYTKPISCFK